MGAGGLPRLVPSSARSGEIPGGATFARMLETQSIVTRWMLRTPEWARNDPHARRLLWTLRLCQVAGLAAFVAWFVVVSAD